MSVGTAERDRMTWKAPALVRQQMDRESLGAELPVAPPWVRRSRGRRSELLLPPHGGQKANDRLAGQGLAVGGGGHAL